MARVAMADLAEKTLDGQYYIWDGDTTGLILADRLLRAADRGVRVRLLIDDHYITETRDLTIAALDAHPNIKIRFFVPEALLPTIALGLGVTIHCDGCKAVPAKVTFISRTSEFTPPVIYSQDERSKLVFLIEARTETPGELRVGQPVDVKLAEAAR